VRIDSGEILSMVGGLFRGAGKTGKKGGILDPAGMQRIVMTSIPFDWIHENIRARRLDALTVSTTHVATGRTFVFIERHERGLPAWSRDPTVVPVAAQITPAHSFASAAIPFLFPAVPIDGEYHCDGGLRQNVPLSPARRLGAESLIVISPKYVADDKHAPIGEPPAPGEQPSPLFLLGKTLNALLLDRIDNDIARLRRTTEFLQAGTRVYGPTFTAEINRAMGNAPERALRPVQTVLIKASKDISKMAAEFVRSPAFSSRASGIVARLLRRMAEGESDLLSYLLFDGEFAHQLIELGRADARAMHEELCRLVTGQPAAEDAASIARGGAL
jgi:NTE family protein